MAPDFARGQGSPRRISDWIGCLGHLAIAAIMVVRTPALTLFVLPAIVHMLFAAGSFMLRDRPQRTERDWFGRIVSYAGGFGVFAFIQVASAVRPDWLETTTNPVMGLIGIAAGALGVSIEIWAIWHLKFAFSTEPAARRLVTSGPYRFARHPIYSGSCIAYAGLLLTRPTMPVALVLFGWAVCVRLRMRYEEAILASAFPAYNEYRRRVGAIGPWPTVKRLSVSDDRAAA